MSVLRFVPEYAPPAKDVINKFLDILYGFKRFVVLTGAGISTESGIPDYRSEKVGQYARTSYRPVDYFDFMNSEKWRKHYWARNTVAFRRNSQSQPNSIHKAVASWENSNRFSWLITQNIDGLHTLAGSQKVTELHGCGRRVKCMKCERLYTREEVQKWIITANPNWFIDEIGTSEPDGDADISDHAENVFNLPLCPHCGRGSILKTDVVFFGDCVPAAASGKCFQEVEECDGLLVLGSSLVVNTGTQYVHQAYLRGVPILIVNIGPTEGDHIATMKISARCSDVVKHINLPGSGS